MSMLLVHELHEARDRVLLLCQKLEKARERELPAYRSFLDGEIGALQKALADAHIPERYRVAVVGRFKVGKSSFVNKLAQEQLAGVETSPETAAISIFRYGEQARVEVALIGSEEWDNLRAAYEENPKDAEVKRYAGFIEFNNRPARKDKDGKEMKREKVDLNNLAAQWLQPGGRVHTISADDWKSRDAKKEFRREVRQFTSSQEPLHYLVNKLTIYAPIPILRDHIELIDTPGLDDTEHFRVLLTEELVRDVDAILFLTTSGASYSNSDKDFLIRQLRRRQIKHLQVIVTKGDETFQNAVRDARENDDEPPTFEAFRAKEISRVRGEITNTLEELLDSNQLTDDEGCYFIDQLARIPVHLISTTFHDEGRHEQGGIDAVRDGLYQILSTSQRFEQSRRVLVDRLDASLVRLRDHYAERSRAIESEYDPNKVKAEIESIRVALEEHLSFFDEEADRLVDILRQQQAGSAKTLPVYLDVVGLLAREVLAEDEKDDLVKHWRTRRVGRWAYLSNLQAKIADRVFPKVESCLNELRSQLDEFMRNLGSRVDAFQTQVRKVEESHELSGLEPMALAQVQGPAFAEMKKLFAELAEAERDGIINRLEDFVSEEVTNRVEKARGNMGNIVGTGTTSRQGEAVRTFYNDVKLLLGKALRSHLEGRIREFAEAVLENASSVAPRIREATLAMIEQRLQAIESTLAIATAEEKERITAYLQEMHALSRNFAAEPDTTESVAGAEGSTPAALPAGSSAPVSQVDGNRVPIRYEIADGATGYTYERIFRPYIDDAEEIVIEDPYIRKPYQVDNFARFCALAVRIGTAKRITLRSGKAFGEDLDEVDSRLETLRRDLQSRGISLALTRDEKLHDREIQFSNGWVVKIGRGLDIYYPPESWVAVDAADFSLRRCRQTKIEAFSHEKVSS